MDKLLEYDQESNQSDIKPKLVLKVAGAPLIYIYKDSIGKPWVEYDRPPDAEADRF